MSEYEFRNITSLRDSYSVFAQFDEGLSQRLFADIVRNDLWDKSVAPEVYIVMMNPGSCKKKKNSSRDAQRYPIPTVVEAVSDPAMKCVMWLMDSCNLKKVRIINLIDIIEPKSANVLRNFSDDHNRSEYLKNSIFSDCMLEKYKRIVADDAYFIIAWGKNKLLNPLKEQALRRIPADHIINSAADEISYDYIKPFKYSLQQDISKKITSEYWKWKNACDNQCKTLQLQ